MRVLQKPVLVFLLVALLAAIDVLVISRSVGVTSEPVSFAKVAAALIIQLTSVLLLVVFLRMRRGEEQPVGPVEHFRQWLTPYFVFGLAVAFALSLLYNGVACGDQSFVHKRRGEPACNVEPKNERAT
jgi:heme/copper-type cytochrome/quinol oxidase subunit 4